MKLSLCITTYNRYEMTLQSFEQVLNDERISEIVIVDDCSTDDSYIRLQEACTNDKIKLYRNETNLGMSRNKARSLELATNDWCILFDSDNVIDGSYINAVSGILTDNNVIYCPDYAKHTFDYRDFAGTTYNMANVAEYMNKSMFRCHLNTCNYIVNKHEYLKVYKFYPHVKASDTITFARDWLNAGNTFYIVPDMQYYHRQHNGSGFLEDVGYNMVEASKVEKEIIALAKGISVCR